MLASIPSVSPRDFSRLAPPASGLHQTGVRLLSTEHRPGTPTSPEGDIRNERERETQGPNAYVRVSALAELDADEQLLESRKTNIRRFGATWIKPPGIQKTLQAMIDEQLEKEEQEAIARRETALHEALRAQEAQLRAQRSAEQPLAHQLTSVEQRYERVSQQSPPGLELQIDTDNPRDRDLDMGVDQDLDADVPNAADYGSDDYDEEDEDQDSEEEEEADPTSRTLEIPRTERYDQTIANYQAGAYQDSAEHRRNGNSNVRTDLSYTLPPISNVDETLASREDATALASFAGGADNRLRNLRDQYH